MPLYTRDRNGTVHAAADQIVWAGDTNLYRSAADTLKTDDNLIVGAVLTVLGTAAFTGAVTGLSKATVGLGSVDNTADNVKPVSIAAQTALDLKAPLASPTFTGTVAGVSKAAVGLSNADNTADSAKPVSTAQATADALRVLKAGDTMTGLLALAAGLAGVGGLTFGPDVNLYRSAADTLKTDDRLQVARSYAGVTLYVDNLDAGGSGIRVTLAAVTGWVLATLVSGEGNNRLLIQADGKHLWGDGTAGQDTTLYRSAAATLKTDGKLDVAGLLSLAAGAANVGGLTIGGDVNLYRSTADQLRTDDSLVVGTNLSVIGQSVVDTVYAVRPSAGHSGYHIKVIGDAQQRFWILADGKHEWGSGTAVPDTNLYRSAADLLKTDDNLLVAGYLTVNTGIYSTRAATASGAVFCGVAGEAQQRLIVQADGNHRWGSGALTQDTNLYRSGANALKTDGTFTAATVVTAALTMAVGSGVNLEVYWQLDGVNKWLNYVPTGSSIMYLRDVPNAKMHVTYVPGAGAGGGATNFNSAVDVAGALTGTTATFSSLLTVSRTSASLGAISLNATGDASARYYVAADGSMNWGSGAAAADTSLYRSAAGQLRVFGGLTVDNALAVTGVTTLSNQLDVNKNTGIKIRAGATDGFIFEQYGTHKWGWRPISPDTTDTIRFASATVVIEGNVLQLASDFASTSRITFGLTSDTNLYRAAAGVLKTDGVFRPGSFTTALRPTAASAGVGGNIYDTTLTKPLWSDGTAWRDAMGTAV